MSDARYVLEDVETKVLYGMDELTLEETLKMLADDLGYIVIKCREEPK